MRSGRQTLFGKQRFVINTALLATLTMAAGCQNANVVAMRIGQPTKDALAVREAQTRSVPAADQVSILSDVTQTLQDLGFSIRESSVDLGIVTGTKHRDAEESGQVASQIALTVAFALLGTAYNPVWDKTQEIHVTTVVAPAQSSGAYSIRVSFDRYITNNQGTLWRTELIHDPVIYQEFFAKLSHGTTLARAM